MITFLGTNWSAHCRLHATPRGAIVPRAQRCKPRAKIGSSMPSRTPTALWTQQFRRSSGSKTSLQDQIRQMLVAAILDGQLPPEVALPSSRELSEQLGVARNTVVLAYQ